LSFDQWRLDGFLASTGTVTYQYMHRRPDGAQFQSEDPGLFRRYAYPMWILAKPGIELKEPFVQASPLSAAPVITMSNHPAITSTGVDDLLTTNIAGSRIPRYSTASRPLTFSVRSPMLLCQRTYGRSHGLSPTRLSLTKHNRRPSVRQGLRRLHIRDSGIHTRRSQLAVTASPNPATAPATITLTARRRISTTPRAAGF